MVTITKGQLVVSEPCIIEIISNVGENEKFVIENIGERLIFITDKGAEGLVPRIEGILNRAKDVK